jgi:MFS family permease
LIVAGSLLYSLCVVLVPLTPGFTLLLGANLILGMLGAVPIPAASASVIEEGKKYGMGSIMALFNVAMSLGLGIGPLVSGVIYDTAGLTSVFYFAAGFGAVGALITARMLRSSPPAPHEELPKLVEEP